MTGRELYERLVELGGGGQDSKDYYDRMNAAVREGWERLAVNLTSELQAARDDGVRAVADAVEDALGRREGRRAGA